MRIEFLKMHGLGNDFILFDAPLQSGERSIDPGKLKALADRHTGIGFDQALMLEPPRDPHSRAFYRVFNADGTEVEQCGNGARCVAALLYSRAPELGREFTLQSVGGRVDAKVRSDGLVAVDMGTPHFEPYALPFDAAAQMPLYALQVNGQQLQIGAVSMGNPHAVLLVSDAENAPVDELGPAIERHPRFGRRTNVGFLQIVDRSHVLLRVFERGVGETLACGTGACAAVAVGRRLELLDADVQVGLKGGTALVSWAGIGQHVWLTGPAAKIFSGSIDI